MTPCVQITIDKHGLAGGLVSFLSRVDVTLSDVDQAATIAALDWSPRASDRRIPDATIAAAAEYAKCDVSATFDQSFRSPSVPVRLI